MAAPLGPGKVCLIGTFGRAWVAIATFETSQSTSFREYAATCMRQAIHQHLAENPPLLAN